MSRSAITESAGLREAADKAGGSQYAARLNDVLPIYAAR